MLKHNWRRIEDSSRGSFKVNIQSYPICDQLKDLCTYFKLCVNHHGGPVLFVQSPIYSNKRPYKIYKSTHILIDGCDDV